MIWQLQTGNLRFRLEKTGHFFAAVNYKDLNAAEEKLNAFCVMM